MTAARHAADEHTLVQEPVTHADAVAEDGPTGERARWIDRDDRDAVAGLPVLRGEPRHQRAFPAAGWPGDADDARPPGLGVQRPQDVRAPGLVVLDDGEEPRDAALVAFPRAGEQRLGGRDQEAATRSRAMTIRWISLVPSPISMSRASRTMRSTG